MFENKRLYKDASRKKICGVLAGFSDYIDADITLLRIFFLLLTIASHSLGIVIYIVCAIIMPDKQDIFNNTDHTDY